jgi:hypothetical protein
VKLVHRIGIGSTFEALLSWEYQDNGSGISDLYERSKKAQWNAATDIDWSIEVPYGAELPDASAFSLEGFAQSPLAPRGRAAWDSFRWEFQNWMVSQFLHGEQGAMIAAARLAECMPDLDCKLYAAAQATDEARHVEAFARYLNTKVPSPYPVSAPLESLIRNLLTDSRWDITALGMQILIEALAMAAFRTANATFNDPLIKQIALLVAKDEARHVAFGILTLEDAYQDLTSAEVREREDFVLEAAFLMQRRFLLEDVWERLEVDRREGAEFAAASPMMIAYRQTIFLKIISALVRIGLMTDRVREGLTSLELIGPRGVSLRRN